MSHSEGARALFQALLLAIIAAAAFATSASALNAPQVSPNYNQTCVLLDTGTVKCVGNGSEGALGHGSTDDSYDYVDVTDVTGSQLTNVFQLAVGDDHACAVKLEGTVWCWGNNEAFQLGQGGASTTRSTRAAPVVSLGGVTQISTQDATTCALIVNGTVKCWGLNDNLQVGDGLPGNRSTPAVVANVSGATKVASGGGSGCALVAGGAAKCWGADGSGQRGDGGGFGLAGTATNVIGIVGATDIGVGNEHGCALVARTVKCWGSDGDGRLGNGEPKLNSDVPVETGLAGATQLAVGYSTTCVLVEGGSAKCWGNNSDGQIGNGSVFDESSPVDVNGVKGAVLIGRDFDYSACVGYPGGRIACWGENEDGQLGLGTAVPDRVTSPTDVPNIDIVTQAHPAISPAAALSGKPKVDRRKRTYTITGTLSAGLQSFVAGAEACAGNATITTSYRYKTVKSLKKRGKRLRRTVRRTRTVRTTPAITPLNGSCSVPFAVKLPVKHLNNKSVRIEASFAGNGAVQSYGATVDAKLPKVKIKKRK